MVFIPDKEINVIKSFSRRKTITLILWIIGAACLGVSASSWRHPENSFTDLPRDVEIWGLLAAAMVIFVISFFVGRCPVCRKFLGIATNIKACRKCHAVFQGGDDKRV